MIRRRHILATTLLASLCAIAADVRAAQPVARMLETKGRVTINDVGEKTRPAAALDTLYLGQRIVLATDSTVTLAFRADGHIERVTAVGEFRVGSSGCEPRRGIEMVQPPSRQKNAVAATVKELRPMGPSGVTIVRGGLNDATPRPLSPIPGSMILTSRPTFTWPPVPRASRYATIIKTGETVVWESAPTTKTQLEYAGEAPLQAGANYSWEVKAHWDGGLAKTTDRGDFTVATEEQKALAAELQALTRGSDVALLTLAAIWYEENRLTAEALGTFQRLASLRPNDVVYHIALVRLYQRANRTDEAAKECRRVQLLQPPEETPLPEWLH